MRDPVHKSKIKQAEAELEEISFSESLLDLERGSRFKACSVLYVEVFNSKVVIWLSRFLYTDSRLNVNHVPQLHVGDGL
jgi:hypothetical protein